MTHVFPTRQFDDLIERVLQMLGTLSISGFVCRYLHTDTKQTDKIVCLNILNQVYVLVFGKERYHPAQENDKNFVLSLSKCTSLYWKGKVLSCTGNDKIVCFIFIQVYVQLILEEYLSCQGSRGFEVNIFISLADFSSQHHPS